jgi:hypothetical protein
MGCCSLHVNGTSGDAGDAHANIGVGPDVYQPGSSGPVNLHRLHALARGQVNDDLYGGLEVLVDPNDANSRLARWQNFYVEDLTSDSTTSSTFVTASSWTVDWASLDADASFIFFWSVLICSGDSGGFTDAEVRLQVEGVTVDTWQSEDNASSLPSVPQTRVKRVDLAGATDPLNINIDFRQATGFDTVVIEDKTVFALKYEG